MSGRIHVVIVELVLAGLRASVPELFDAGRSGARFIDLVAQHREQGSVPLPPYRGLLREVRNTAGGRALLACGAPLRELTDPFVFVLLNAGSPEAVIAQEARLARFLHSRHRVAVEASTDHGLDLRHTATSDRPTPEEHLVNCGLHAALLREIGCTGVTCTLPESDAPERVVFEDGEADDPAAGGSYALWRFRWTAFTPTRRPLPGLDDLLLRGAAPVAIPDEAGWADQVRAALREDLARSWRLDDVAAHLGLARRTLQRELSREGTSFRTLLEGARVSEAERLLRTSDLSVTAIGYLCGFADTSHFSRAFKRTHGFPPSALDREAPP